MSRNATPRPYRLTPEGRAALLANLEAARQAPGFLVYRPTPKRLAALEANLNKALKGRWDFHRGDAVTTRRSKGMNTLCPSSNLPL